MVTATADDLSVGARVVDESGMTGEIVDSRGEGRRRQVCIEWDCRPENRRVWFDVETARFWLTRVIV